MWTIEHNGIEQSFEEWGLAKPVFDFNASAVSYCTLRAVQEVDSQAILPEADPAGGNPNQVIIKRGGVVVWVGMVIETPMEGSASAEEGVYRLADYWHLLEQTVLHQSRKSYDNAIGQLVDVFTTHLWLGQATDGTRQTSGEVMEDALIWARAVSATSYAFQFSTAGFPQLDVPLTEVRDITCAEAIRTMLRWSPDAVFWLDYSNYDPALGPVFRCGRRSDLAGVSVDMSDGSLVGEMSIASRRDLLRPSVKLTYEIAEQVNGVAYVRTEEDIAPAGATGRELGALAATINLQGAVVQTVEQEVLTQPIEAFHANVNTRLNWWKQQFPELAGSDVQSLSIDLANITRLGPNFYPNQLIDGTLADWMGVQAESDLITAKAFITDATGGRWKTLPVRLLATTAVTGIYRHNQAVTYPEPIPVNLAADVYVGVSDLHWQGDLVLNEEEVTFLVGIGNVLNLNGGRSAWKAMNALVYQVSVDVDTGQTRVSFGNPEHLGVADLVELLRAARSRTLETLPLVRTTAVAGIGGVSNFAKTLPNRISTGKESGAERAIISKPGNGEIDIDAETAFDLQDNPIPTVIDGKVLKVREMEVCIQGDDKRILVMASEPYDPPPV